MIGLDTNALLRWLLADSLTDEDAGQAAAVGRALADARDAVHINPVVLAECAWVLRARFGQGRDATAQVLRALLDAPTVDVAHRPAVESALTAFENGGPGFADHLIGALNRAAGCRTTLTFDRAAAKSPDFTSLA